MAKVSEKFARAVQRYEPEGMKSNEAKNLRKIAYEEAHHDAGFDPKNAVAYAAEFQRLAGQTTDKASTAAYLRNAANEFQYLDEDLRSGPAVAKVLKKLPELKEILQDNTQVDSGSVFGSPNAAVQHYIRLDNVEFTHGWEYYAEKVAELVRSDPKLKEFKDVVNTIVFQGYGAYRIPDEIKSGDLEVPRMTGPLTVSGAPKLMRDVLADVSDGGKVRMADAHKVLHLVIYDVAKAFESEAGAKAYLSGIEKLIPFSAHKAIKSALQEAKKETEVGVKVHTAKPKVEALVAAHRQEAAFKDLIAGGGAVTVGAREIVLLVKRETADPSVLEAKVRDLVAADPELAAMGVGVSVSRKYD